ncbi:hypothetical protein RJ640_004399 [Escallonia rubra]|uniref:Uncharacterized protein n=1 Tax=Escallonia rubra TaxID=112253 RepID=A0AA88QKM7_9ASTE|nr:hypothetical protein RJ640_004399 [Escallonia rubra]
MSESCATEVAEGEVNSIQDARTKIRRKVDDGTHLSLKKKLNSIILLVTKPSYTLRRGVGIPRPDIGALRWANRNRLRESLRKLLRRHNWDEASGLLSVLLKGTCKDTSNSNNRTKYLATMEFLKHTKGCSINPRKFQHLFELWMKKIGIRSRGNSPVKDRFVVRLEYIVFCLSHGNIEDAHQAIISLMQEREYGSDPMSNLVVGLTFCQLWYTVIRKEFQLRDSEESCTPTQSETLESRFNMSSENSDVQDGVEVQESNTELQHDSNTSVRNDKEIGLEEVDDQLGGVKLEVDDYLQSETPYRNFQPQGLYVNSGESNGHEESSVSYHASSIPHASIFSAPGLDPLLLPLRLPHLKQNLEDFIFMQKKMHNDYYKAAVNYLQVALYSTPSEIGALLPLIQFLLLGDQVKEALDELEKFIHNSDISVPLRLKASLLEHFYSNNYVKLSSCFEDILKKDPTCSHSLMRLISLHQNGYYSAETLLEMVALHLDATYAGCDTWKEFAYCFMKLSQCEEDRISVCVDANQGAYVEKYSNQFMRTLGIFSDGAVGKNWRLRCQWWLARHFSRKRLASEIAAGDFRLLTYKAASACHLYGREFDYVVKASTCLERQKDRDLFLFLQTNMKSSVGFYFSFGKKS